MSAPAPRSAVRGHLADATRWRRGGMWMARTTSAAGTRDIAPYSSPHRVDGGSERAERRQSLPTLDAGAKTTRSRPSLAIEGDDAVPLGRRKASEATAKDRQPNPGPAQTSASRLDGVCMSQARRRSTGTTHFAPDDGRSVPEPDPQQSTITGGET